MIPRCSTCDNRIGWTRYIRRVHLGRSIICRACSFREALRTGAKVFS